MNNPGFHPIFTISNAIAAALTRLKRARGLLDYIRRALVLARLVELGVDRQIIVETRIRYEADGSIHSDDEEFDQQLEEVLNLNIPFLKNNRKGILDAILDWWRSEKRRLKGPVPRERFERERNRRIDGVGDLEPCCQVAVWWLEQRLARMSA